MAETRRNILVTSALPYANGDIHIGHLVEYLQTDFWVRFQKMRGHRCVYVCADDTHGTPIMLKAREQNISPEQLIAATRENHLRDFGAFQIEFDHYGSTNADSNRELSLEFYEKLKPHIFSRDIEQMYCGKDAMFLPDRFIKGTCPKCRTPDQYGDSCDNCSSTYAPSDLIDPFCAICGIKPEVRNSEHLFFRLEDFRSFLKEWVPAHTQSEISNKLDEWLQGELSPWDISRDEPYFGFAIPDKPGKFFYVWLDAPIGYISSTRDWAEKIGEDWKTFWIKEESELYHFIGKDIVYFHTLFWPAMLKAASHRTPTRVFVHGFLTVDGKKMSKSRGTFIKAETWLRHLAPEYLRYYYACKMSSSIDDIDLNLKDMVGRINSDLVGKITNLASRGAQMTNKKLDGKLGTMTREGREILTQLRARESVIASLYENRDFSKAIVEIRSFADTANEYFDRLKPWELIKTDPETVRAILTDVLNIFRGIAIYLQPVLPVYAARVATLFGEKSYDWKSLQTDLENISIQPFEHLLQRLDAEALEAIVAESRESGPPA